MKKVLITSALPMLLLTIAAFKPAAPKAKLFAHIEQYYAGLSTPPAASQSAALSDLKNYIVQGASSDTKINMVFACSDNSFNSIAAQVVLQSLLSSNKIAKLGVYSCGYQPTTIQPQLIKVLSKHGFQVSETNTDGKKAYEIKYGENMPSLTVFAKSTTDASLPTKGYFLLKLCGAGENNCTDLSGAAYKNSLPFGPASAAMTDEEADKAFSAIASAIVYAFNQSKP